MRNTQQFVLCVRNHGCFDLAERKIYQVLPDAAAAEDGLLRIVDESDEDYLYPADYFHPIAVPEKIVEALATKASPPKKKRRRRPASKRVREVGRA